MDMLFLNEPTAPLNKFLDTHNIRSVRLGREVPGKVEAIYTHGTVFNKKDYPMLKWVLCPMTGTRHLGFLNNTNIQLFKLNDRQWLFDNAWSTAEFTLSMILRLWNGLRREIRGTTIGFVGFGRVSQQIYKLIENWEVNIIWYDLNETLYRKTSKGNMVSSMDDIFLESDIISISVDENPLTMGFINRKQFSLCTKQPIIINTARASLINYVHMLEAFNDGKIAGFGLDVDIDYMEKDKKTWREIEDLNRIYKGVLVTPHIAGKGLESRIITDRYVFGKFVESIGE